MTRTLFRFGSVAIEFKLEDFWIGAFWQTDHFMWGRRFHLWLCFVPCFPIHITRTCIE